MRALVLALLVVLASLAGCSTAVTTALDQAHRPTTPAPALKVVPYTDPLTVTGVQPGSCLAGDGGASPDPVCTPGSVGTVDVGLVCVPRFEATKRPSGRAWTSARQTAIVAYDIPERDYPRVEYDHRVPLSLGGADDTSNLWPQVSDLPGKGSRNAKDAIETRVWNAVCHARTVALADAQRAFAGDWRTALAVLHIPPVIRVAQ